ITPNDPIKDAATTDATMIFLLKCLFEYIILQNFFQNISFVTFLLRVNYSNMKYFCQVCPILRLLYCKKDA
ncbi:MAG: hypothetical protein K6F30_05600, partial [Lachnospiraceae bacterium]|nr:hypothetical protein [Lachnospiraceae bacterium]